jgi:hypothetical protein
MVLLRSLHCMKIHEMRIGMTVNHPQHGEGIVEKITGNVVDVRFGNILRTIDPELADVTAPEPMIKVGEAEVPLKHFVSDVIENTISATIHKLGVEDPSESVSELGTKWNKGRAVLHPADPSLQPKEVPLEVFFHKVVGVRNQLRVLEQKINAHPNLSDGDKVEMQQYISRCYGSLTTFNVLFKNKEDQFSSKGE